MAAAVATVGADNNQQRKEKMVVAAIASCGEGSGDEGGIGNGGGKL